MYHAGSSTNGHRGLHGSDGADGGIHATDSSACWSTSFGDLAPRLGPASENGPRPFRFALAAMRDWKTVRTRALVKVIRRNGLLGGRRTVLRINSTGSRPMNRSVTRVGCGKYRLYLFVLAVGRFPCTQRQPM